MFDRIGFDNDGPLTERLQSRVSAARPHFELPFSAPAFFSSPPPMMASSTSPVDAMLSQAPQRPPTLKEALDIIQRQVVAAMGEDTDYFWRWTEFSTDLQTRIAVLADECKAELQKRIQVALAEGREARAEVERLEVEHRNMQIAWNAAEGARSQAQARLNAVASVQLDEFAGPEEIAAQQRAIRDVEAVLDEASQPGARLILDMNVQLEKVAAAKRRLSQVRDRLRSLREEL